MWIHRKAHEDGWCGHCIWKWLHFWYWLFANNEGAGWKRGIDIHIGKLKVVVFLFSLLPACCWCYITDTASFFWQRRLRDVSIPTCLDKSDDHRSDNGPEFCIDAGSTGNIARFINHSCQPNLFVQCVLSSHHDIKLARVVLFAADNIPPLKVLYSVCVVFL